MDMTAGRINAWLVKEGEFVAKGGPLFEIETDKAAMEIEAPAAGILRGVTASEGEDVQVGLTIAWIVAEGEAWAPSDKGLEAIDVASSDAESDECAAAPPQGGIHTEPQVPGWKQTSRATPLARREARRLGVPLDTIHGSGPRGRVFSRDLAEAKAASLEMSRASLGDGAPLPSLKTLSRQPASETGGPRSSSADRVTRSIEAPRSFSQNDGMGVHREWLGLAEGTPVVFLHGFGGDLSSWRAVWARSARDHRILAVDLPGHGRSTGQGTPSFRGLVDAVAATLQSEGISSLHLVGHSLGGAVALGLVETAGFDVQSLCLIAPAGLGAEIDSTFIAGLLSATQEASLRPWLLRLFTNADLVSAGFVRSTLSGLQRPGLREFQANLAGDVFTDGTQTVDLRHVLGQLAIPTKVLWGKQDRIIPCRHGYALPARIGLHLLDTGHMPHLQEATVVADLVKELTCAARPGHSEAIRRHQEPIQGRH